MASLSKLVPTLTHVSQSLAPAKAASQKMQFRIGGPSGNMTDEGVLAFCEAVLRELPFKHKNGHKWIIVSEEVLKAICKSNDARTMKLPSAEKMKEMLTCMIQDEVKYRKTVMLITDETGNPARGLAANGLSQAANREVTLPRQCHSKSTYLTRSLTVPRSWRSKARLGTGTKFSTFKY